MAEFLTNLADWMMLVAPIWAYAAIIVVSYMENIIPPIPGDMIVVLGGYLVGVGKLSFVLVILLSTVGGALGFMTMYWIGVSIEERVLEQHRFRWLPKDRIERARNWLHRWGYGVVAANRFLSGARSIISLTVGMAKMDPTKTAAWATLSALVWTGLITYAGYVVGDNWLVIARYLHAYGKLTLTILVAVALGWSGWNLFRTWKQRVREREQ
jgi:membrane protein DedA with SNARE-associated domain